MKAYQRQWKLAHPESVAAYRARWNESRRVQPTAGRCSECGETFEGRPDRVVCRDPKCKAARWRRLNPEAYEAAERRKVAARRERRKVKP